MDSLAERRSMIAFTAPSFGPSGSVNSGFVRLMLTDADQRKRSQQEIATALTAKMRQFNDGRAIIIQQQTIQLGSGGGGGGGLPVQFVIQAETFEKLVEKLPKFMEDVQKSPVFVTSDVNLKFNKPELFVKIDQIKSQVND